MVATASVSVALIERRTLEEITSAIGDTYTGLARLSMFCPDMSYDVAYGSSLT